jgi:lipopolysaccharide biosynthesis regulator YciM
MDYRDEADLLSDTLDPLNFTPKERIDIGLNSGKLSINHLLTQLAYTESGIPNPDLLKEIQLEKKMQSRLAHAVNLANANSLSERHEKDIKYPEKRNNPKLRAFSASRGIIANRFVNRLHKSASNRSLTNAQLRLVVWEALGVELFNGVNYTCRHCKMQATTYTAHCEACKCSRKISRTTPMTTIILKLLTHNATHNYM